MTQSQDIKFNSFFAGIGGFDLGFERAGFTPAFHCEINHFCQSVLEKHWPAVPLSNDITTLSITDIPAADVWCGGFPCQDVSVARGSKGRDGLKGKNSGLFFEFADKIKVQKPKVILIENVLGLLSSHNGQDFRVILETLTDLGYAVSWRVMNSRFFGAPQSRPRVFICAAMANPKLALSVLYEKPRGHKSVNKRQGFLNITECSKSGAKVADVAYCLAATSGRHTGTDWSRTYISYDSEVRRLTPTECEGLQGFPKDWTLINSTGTSKKVDNDSVRYHALGNAVSVPVVEWIAERLKVSLENNTRAIKAPTMNKLMNILSEYEDFSCKTFRTQNLKDLQVPAKDSASKLKWQAGGLAYNGKCIDVKAPESPSIPIVKKLIKVIEKTTVHQGYYLSPNAAEGILRRVYSQNRTLFPPLHDALVNLSKK
jgi:DNA (cytosine-5)-methyltransferase 1